VVNRPAKNGTNAIELLKHETRRKKERKKREISLRVKRVANGYELAQNKIYPDYLLSPLSPGRRLSMGGGTNQLKTCN